MESYEKLGTFYLGRVHDVESGTTRPDLLLYDSRDLVTHGVCVGMTGSGKTGLCVALLEEAAIDGIPALVIDPKGDLVNLMLTFPDLSPAAFRPWVLAEEAGRKGVSLDDFARQQAELWTTGLQDWAQDGDRIRRLQAGADFTVYTPGSRAGLPLSILKSFSAPPPQILADDELRRERISTTVSSLLGLLGIDADPIQSRDHILLSNILDVTWTSGAGSDSGLSGLIRLIQTPPMTRVGVMDLESFYPSKERFALAMRLNNLLAAPSFQSWLEGEPLDVQRLLFTPDGKPRISILSIAHLQDAERMFFVSLLFNEALAWMRTQPGTTSLRALLYMDEIAGYLPPTANPASKAPLLTLLKQARAFGFGVLLSTQNPVDLDYKALSNAGTWFIGRLQTERDKARLLDGLEGAVTRPGLDRAALDKLISGLGKRVFLLHNVHEDHPEVFHTRWAMSYLRGPMTREEIQKLMDPKRSVATSPAAAAAPAPAPASAKTVHTAADGPPVLEPGVPVCAVPAKTDRPEGAALVYRASICGSAHMQYTSRTPPLEIAVEEQLLSPVSNGDVTWDEAEALGVRDEELLPSPEAGARFEALDPAASRSKSYATWERDLRDWLYQNRRIELFRSPTHRVHSNVGESEGDFRVRLRDLGRQERDQQAEKLRAKYATAVEQLDERIRRADHALDKQREQHQHEKTQTAISVGAALLSSFLGRKRGGRGALGRATTAVRGAGRARSEGLDVERAEENRDVLETKRQELEEQFKRETEALEATSAADTEKLEVVTIRAKKTDINVRRLALAWVPYWQTADGRIQRA